MPKKNPDDPREDPKTSCVWLYENKAARKAQTTGAVHIR
jgi:hypothetical protein